VLGAGVPSASLLAPEVKDPSMRLARLIVVVLALITLAFVAGGYAAAKSYQFSGVVKVIDAGTVAVEKSGKETWQFEVSKDTKGQAKVGDKVTVYYKMVATEIESKPATATATKKK
jgi:hypothetical protein